jgi:hypothetical protein
MALPIPEPFDLYAPERQFDANEIFIRDELGLTILNWAKFRHAIHIGNRASNLYSSALIPEEVKEAYRELAKSHYEAVTSLGRAKLALHLASEPGVATRDSLRFSKSVKDFYCHSCCVVDSLARLIYIINDPDSAFKKDRRYKGCLRRHKIGWGSLGDYDGYKRLKDSRQLREIRDLRNNLTHSWMAPHGRDASNLPWWPIAVRKRGAYLWPYDELDEMKRVYKGWQPVLQMLEDDLAFIDGLQNNIFGKLVRDVRKFERNYGIEIR